MIVWFWFSQFGTQSAFLDTQKIANWCEISDGQMPKVDNQNHTYILGWNLIYEPHFDHQKLYSSICRWINRKTPVKSVNPSDYHLAMTTIYLFFYAYLND